MSSSSHDAGIPVLTEIIPPRTRPAVPENVPELSMTDVSATQANPSIATVAAQPALAPSVQPVTPPRATSRFSGWLSRAPATPVAPETPAAAPAAAIAPLTEIAATLEAPVTQPIDGWLKEEWTRMEQKISERTLTNLLDRLDPALEEQIRESISASLDEAMDTVRVNLQRTVENLVRQVVAEEITKMDVSKNKD